MGAILSVLFMIIYLFVIIFVIRLLIRFVTAIEQIAGSVENYCKRDGSGAE